MARQRARRTERPKKISEAGYEIDLPELDDLRWLNLHTVSRLTGFAVSTLHVQFQRGIYPDEWSPRGQQGRAREISPGFTLHLMVVAELVLGWAIPIANASAIALDVLGRLEPVPRSKRVQLSDAYLKAVIGARPRNAPGQIAAKPIPFWVLRARRLADIERELGDELPANFIVLDLAGMVERLCEAAKGGGPHQVELPGV